MIIFLFRVILFAFCLGGLSRWLMKYFPLPYVQNVLCCFWVVEKNKTRLNSTTNLIIFMSYLTELTSVIILENPIHNKLHWTSCIFPHTSTNRYYDVGVGITFSMKVVNFRFLVSVEYRTFLPFLSKK